MKLESLVIAHQHGAVNTFPGLVHTARHTIRVGDTRSRQAYTPPVTPSESGIPEAGRLTRKGGRCLRYAW